MFDMDAVGLTDEDLVETIFRSRSELYLAIGEGFAKQTISRQVGGKQIVDQSSFYDGLEFAIFLYLERFLDEARAKAVADEWADVIANSL